jgi:hypothetical protein
MERNLENAMRCFAQEAYSDRRFAFVPDQEIASNHPGLFASWDLTQEETVFRQAFSLVPADSLSLLDFPSTVREAIVSDSAVLVREYRLVLNHPMADLPRRYEGQAEFHLSEDRKGEWVIHLWIDFKSRADSEPWSGLKAVLGG